MFLNSARHLGIFSELKDLARDTFDTILQNDFEGLAGRVAISWELNQRLDEGTNPSQIQDILHKINDYLLGFKLLGAGGGGFLLLYCPKPKQAAVRKALNDLSVLEFSFEPEGSKIIYVV